MSNPFAAATAAASAALSAAPAPSVEAAPAPASVQAPSAPSGTPVTSATAELAEAAGLTVERPQEVATDTQGEPAPDAEAPQATEPAEPPVDAQRPGIKAAQEFRRQFLEARETAAAERARREVLEQTLVPVLQQFIELQRAQQAPPVQAAPPEPEFDDMGDPALRELHELRKELAEQKKWRESVEAERQYHAKVAEHEQAYRNQWGQLKASHPALQTQEGGKAFWDRVAQYPDAPLPLIAQLIVAELGSRPTPGDSRPGQVPARPVPAQSAPNVPPRPAPPRPPPGGMAAAVPVAQPLRTFESATEAALAALRQGRI